MQLMKIKDNGVICVATQGLMEYHKDNYELIEEEVIEDGKETETEGEVLVDHLDEGEDTGEEDPAFPIKKRRK